MGKEQTATKTIDIQEVSEPTKASTCLTPWEAFEQAGVYPREIMCQDYVPLHAHDGSCHSRVMLVAQNVANHIGSDHGSGGGFQVTLAKPNESKPTKFWQDLKTLGLECHDFRCEVCDQEVPMVGRRILKHFAAHSGRSRRPRAGGTFNMTLSFAPPDLSEEGIEW